MFTHFLIIFNVYPLRINTKTVYIVKTFEQPIHLFITMCAEKKMSVSQVTLCKSHAVFKNDLTVEGKLKKGL